MKLLIAYTSKTGNTREFARRIDEEVSKSNETRLYDIEDKEKIDFSEYDALLIGTWIDKGTAVRRMQNFIKKIEGCDVVFFGTIGAMPDSEHGIESSENIKKLLSSNNNVLDCVLLPGTVESKLIGVMARLPKFIVSEEIKNKMIESAENSRNPSEEEYREALDRINSCLNSLS